VVVVVEGDTDLPFVRRLAEDAGLGITTEIDAGGKGTIDRELAKYNNAGRSIPWVVVRDLDTDAPCAGEFVMSRKLKPTRWFRLRLAVREVESWVLADAEGLSKFIDVDAKWIPTAPDVERDATASLLEVARRASSSFRRKLLPGKGSSAVVGPLYEATLIEFGERGWDLQRAAMRSPSLRRAQTCMRKLAHEWHSFINRI